MYFIILGVTYVILMLHDNATLLRRLKCLILLLKYSSIKKSLWPKFPLGGGGSTVIPRSIS